MNSNLYSVLVHAFERTKELLKRISPAMRSLVNGVILLFFFLVKARIFFFFIVHSYVE